jgi:hypothetical protein
MGYNILEEKDINKRREFWKSLKIAKNILHMSSSNG